MAIVFIKPTLTGFVILNENKLSEASKSVTEIVTGSHETANQTTETITTDTTTTTNETISEDKDKKDKEEKPDQPEKPEPNAPPVWKSDVNEFILKGKTAIDLSQYFYDANNDSLAYLFTTPERVNVDIDGSVVALTPKGHNFTTTISFTATDGDKATSKEITLIVPEKSITTNLEYKSGSAYDADDNGYETTTGVVDLSVENSLFSWDVDETKLCTQWQVHSIEEGKSTTVCYGSAKCCNFVGLEPTREKWNDVFYSTYGQYGATLNNIVSAQTIYVDYQLSVDEPFAEIYYSSWKDLTASHYFAFIDFEDVCVETCSLTGFNDTSYKLVFEIDNAVLNLDVLTYSTAEEISNVRVALAVKDDKGLTSGSYQLYKNNTPVSIIGELVEPDYYDIEVLPTENVNFIDKLIIKNTDITKPVTADIGIDKVTREIGIENADVKKRYAINLEELYFEKAVLTATASADSLYECKQWDYDSEVCFGTWEKIKDLIADQQYELALTKETSGFIEGNLNKTLNLSELNITTNITELILFANITDITIIKNNNATINLSNYFLNIDNETIFNYYKPGNISIAFDNDIATIVPDKDFIGIEYSYITANKSNSLSVSNVFIITVIEKTQLMPLNVTGVIINITDQLTHQKLVKYAETNLKPAFRYSSIQFRSYQVTNDVVIVYIAVDGKDIRWLTSLHNFRDILQE